MPDANQAFRELTMQIVADRAEGEVRPRVFFEDFPNMVLYVREIPPERRLAGRPGRRHQEPGAAGLFLARTGRMLVDRQARTIQMVLQDGARHTTKLDDPTAVRGASSFQQMVVSLDPGERLSPHRPGPRRPRADSVAELRERVDYLEAQPGCPPTTR